MEHQDWKLEILSNGCFHILDRFTGEVLCIFNKNVAEYISDDVRYGDVKIFKRIARALRA